MPISTRVPIRSYSQEDFGRVAFEVVGHAFEMHGALGKKFHESVYKGTLRQILGERAIAELAITITHGTFLKDFYVDLFVDSGCPFELKATSKIANNHISQLIHYLMLLDVRHGKLINFGAERVEHRFVNCHETLEQRRRFKMDRHCWDDSAELMHFEETLVALLSDWGTGLSRSLYEEACIHLFDSHQNHSQFTETFWNERPTGRQPVNMLGDGFAFEVTCKRDDLAAYAAHLHKFVANTRLKAILWANVTSGIVRLERIGR